MLTRLNRTGQWLLTLILGVGLLWAPVAAQISSVPNPVAKIGCMVMASDVGMHMAAELTCSPEGMVHVDCAECDAGACQCPTVSLIQSLYLDVPIQHVAILPIQPGVLPPPLLEGLERPPRI